MKASTHKNTTVVVFTFLIMMLIGFVGNLRGVLLPAIKQNLSISYTSFGLLIFITGIGYMIAVMAGGIISDKLGHRKVFIFAFMLVTMGIAGIAYTGSFPVLVVTMTLLYMGLGSFDVAVNTLAPRLFVANTAVMMNIMHLFFGVGSSASPKIASWLMAGEVSWNLIYTFSLIMIAAAFVLFLFCPLNLGSASVRPAEKASLTSLLANKKVWLLIGVLGFCEATEVGFTSWFINFLQVERGLDAGSSAQYMFYFFLAYVIGRVLGGHIAERVGYIRTVAASVSIVAILFACGLFLGAGWEILFSLMGPFISVMFPTMIALIAKEFRQGAGSVMGIILTSAGLICMFTNSLIGKLNDSMGVFAGFAAILAYAMLILVFLGVLSRYLAAEKRVRIHTMPSSPCEEY